MGDAVEANRPHRGLGRVRAIWEQDRSGLSLDLLRIGMGFIWGLNLLFILIPANQYFPTFQAAAASYGAQTIGGPGIANFVAAYAGVFAWLIAIATAYLCVAFLFGLTTRLACYVGIVASAFFFVTQFTMTFMIPGGTDVGAHPLYLLIYVVLLAGGAGRYLSVDGLLWAEGTRFPRLARALNSASPAAPPVLPPLPAARPRARSPFALWTILAVVSFVGVLGASAVVAMPAPSPAVATSGSTVNVVNVEYEIRYAGGASTGAFGPAEQPGCFACAVHAAPGNTTTEEVMLTNSAGGAAVSVTAINVTAPFGLADGPRLPYAVTPDQMWMFPLELTTPTSPGDYTVEIVFTVG